MPNLYGQWMNDFQCVWLPAKLELMVSKNAQIATNEDLQSLPKFQVLYFIPRLRSCFLNVSPDASLEFSLLDELALCFRMLASEAGHACQATNFLRALRQSREATGLGLLEGNRQQSSSRSADIEVSPDPSPHSAFISCKLLKQLKLSLILPPRNASRKQALVSF